ncbi:MAG TPA: solute carrier family 23 protein, partial [Tetragenococcus sp.]|nr:solute carrier family 23 protein [Tetragenococcus sp.]
METEKGMDALYEFDAKPKLGEILSLALQHVVASIVGIVTPGLMIAQACNLNQADTTLILQTALVFAGITTLIQVFPIFGKLGARLPLMMGASFAYVPILLSIGVQFGIAAIFGAQLIGGLVVMIVGVFIKKIRFIFPPIVTGTVILSIGFSLFPVAVKYMAGGVG